MDGTCANWFPRSCQQLTAWCLCSLVIGPLITGGVRGARTARIHCPGGRQWAVLPADGEWASLRGAGSQGGAALSDGGWASARGHQKPQRAEPWRSRGGLGLLHLLQGQPRRQSDAEWGVCEPGWRESPAALAPVSQTGLGPLCASAFHLQNDAAASAGLESSFQL